MKNFIFLVAVSVIAGLVLLKLEDGIFQDETRLLPIVVSTPKSQSEYDAPRVISQKPIQSQSDYDDPQVISHNPKDQSVNSVQGFESNTISEALQLALKIQSPSNRDTALQELVSTAFEENDLLLAIEIADSIYSPSTRDMTYARIIDQALLISDFKTAGIAANEISSPSLMDSQLQKILRARVKSE